jgi:hypothetical protein
MFALFFRILKSGLMAIDLGMKPSAFPIRFVGKFRRYLGHGLEPDLDTLIQSASSSVPSIGWKVFELARYK